VRKKVLIVVDSIFWVTGTMAVEIQKGFTDFDCIVCSYFSLKQVLQENNGEFPEGVDIVHYFINAYSNENHPIFRNRSAIISTIHHVEDESDILPLSYSDAIQTVCVEWHEYLESRGASGADLFLVPNGIDTRLYAPANNRALAKKWRSRHGIPEDALVVGFSAKRSSNTSDRKGVDVLERLVAQSASEKNGLWWVIRGPGWQELVEILQKQGAPVTYLPFVLPGKALARSYQIMDAYVVTSRIEGGPVPLMEAMACGLPVISTPVGTALDVIKEGRNGFFVDFGDDREIIRKLLCLRENLEERRQVGASARKSIVEKYNWARVLQRIPDMYAHAIEKYAVRAGSPAYAGAVPFSKNLKTEIQLLNLKYASQELQIIGAANGGRYYATIGFLRAPFDPVNFRRFFFWTYLGWLYFKLLSIFSFLKKNA
jgi:glycosyltransferase involved in cell wall biosynthesis